MPGAALTDNWAKNTSGPTGDDGIMKNLRIMYAPTSFAVAVSKSRRNLLHLPANPRRPQSLPKQEASQKKKKGKRLGSHFANWWGGVWEENAYIISQRLILYPNISGRTRRIRNKIRPVHSISHHNTGEDFVNTSTESVSSRNRSDCREVYLLGFFSLTPWWYITGMTEAFCESCSM